MSTSMLNETRKQQRSEKDIYFFKEDLDRVMKPHEDPLVISVDKGPDTTIGKVIVDSGSSMDVL